MKVFSPFDLQVTPLAARAAEELIDEIRHWTNPQWHDDRGPGSMMVAYNEEELMRWFKNTATLTFHLARLAQRLEGWSVTDAAHFVR